MNISEKNGIKLKYGCAVWVSWVFESSSRHFIMDPSLTTKTLKLCSAALRLRCAVCPQAPQPLPSTDMWKCWISGLLLVFCESGWCVIGEGDNERIFLQMQTTSWVAESRTSAVLNSGSKTKAAAWATTTAAEAARSPSPPTDDSNGINRFMEEVGFYSEVSTFIRTIQACLPRHAIWQSIFSFAGLRLLCGVAPAM